MTEIVWSKLADKDLDNIYEYIAKDSLLYAEQTIDQIIKRVDQLINFPESGREVPEFSDKTLKELIEGNYRIVYRIRKNKISIARVHHSSRDLSSNI